MAAPYPDSHSQDSPGKQPLPELLLFASVQQQDDLPSN